ncbi:MAG: winged helix-turn-helix domain-containing protein [Candidatus Methanosuratincola sp.]
METKLIEEIEGLRNEIRALGRDFGKIRYEDLRRAFCDEVRTLVGIETQGLINPEMNGIGRTSECRLKEHCFEKLRETIEEGLRRFARGDTTGALHLLTQLEALIESSERPCLDAACMESVSSLTKEVKILITVFDTTLGSKCSRAPSDPPDKAITGKTKMNGLPEPIEIENALMPLSNRWRITLLRLLSQGSMKFTEMSRALGLRTGHLQFHLRMLAKEGYLAADRVNKTYMITERGRAALSWAEAFASMLRDGAPSASSTCAASAGPPTASETRAPSTIQTDTSKDDGRQY